MQLWTDYEGVTIDGVFPLQKLLSPEGRSAFFSTAGPNGEPAVVRLIECHFDEEEILARWRCVEALSHPNFLKFERYGQTELDGRPVVYAVFEMVDANLAGVLEQGHLSAMDVAQLAQSLVAALDVLHTHGYVHEHIEPRNIFAVGDVVKLRSDCIREAPEGAEGRALKKRDVRDLATVLLQALTLRKSIEDVPSSSLPTPFGQIIRNGLDGTWELSNITAALESQLRSKQSARQRSIPDAVKSVSAAPAAAPTVAPAAEANGSGPTARPSLRPDARSLSRPDPRLVARPDAQAEPGPDAPPDAGPNAQLPLPLPSPDADRQARSPRTISREDTWGEAPNFPLRWHWLAAAGVLAVLLVLGAWAIAHAWNVHRHNALQAAAAAGHESAPSSKLMPPSPAPRRVTPNAQRASSAGSHANWRVIPYTYNRRTDAEKKVSSLAHDHPELRPAVFTPSGRAPYLVSIGGLMERDAAYALAHRSRSLGLPHDTYAQNYNR